MNAPELLKKHRPFGPVALVTGASDGIGKATAEALAAKGFDLVLVARRKAKLDTIAADLARRFGVTIQTIAADLSSDDAVENLVAQTAEQDIGIAVLAAGFGTSGRLGDVDYRDEQNMLRVNCETVLRLSQVFGQRMEARGRGQLVLFGSIVGFQGAANAANYAASKAYVQTLAEGLALELKPLGVNVLSVAPGPVASGFAARANMTMGQAGTPDGVAKGIVRAIGTSGTIRPGLLSKVLGYNLALTPRFLRTRIMSGIMSGMANSKGRPTLDEIQDRDRQGVLHRGYVPRVDP